LKRLKRGNIEEGDGTKGEPLEVIQDMRAKKKIKIGECTTLKKGATNTNHPSPLSLL